MIVLVYTVSFKTIQSKNFSKWRLLIFSGGNHPYSPSFTAYLSPRTPDFFHQTDRKGCTLDYLDGLGHFLFGLRRQGKKSRGPPPWGDEGSLHHTITPGLHQTHCFAGMHMDVTLTRERHSRDLPQTSHK